MNEIVNSVTGGELTRPDDLETRLFRMMVATVTIAAVVSTIVAPWRVTTGLLLGGLLSLLNFRWLHGSVAALLDVRQLDSKPRMKLSKLAVRYFVIGGAVFTGYKLQLISLPATIAGLCSFVPALFVEASRQFYFAINHREESF